MICTSGDVLAQEQVSASSKEKVLNAVGGVAARLRRQLGESLTTVQKYDVPLAEATTSSLEALKAYSLGIQTRYVEDEAAALPFFQRAVELDPDFAQAYRIMAAVYSNLGETGHSVEYAQKAYQLRERSAIGKSCGSRRFTTGR